MRILLLIPILLAFTSCAGAWNTWTQTGSVYRGRCTHVGIRPATTGTDYAFTVQVSTDWPQCPKDDDAGR